MKATMIISSHRLDEVAALVNRVIELDRGKVVLDDRVADGNMVISDPRFAAEMRGGEKDVVFKFDDIGCLVFWLRDKAAQHPWMADAATRMWVADVNDMRGGTWHDPRAAHYVGGRLSPMGYNFAAVADAVPQSLTFAQMREQILAKGK
jgi:copper chaperone NosL